MKSVFVFLALLFTFAFTTANAAPAQVDGRGGRGERGGRGDHGRGGDWDRDRRGDREDYGRGDHGRGDHGRGDYGRGHGRDRDEDYGRGDDRRDHDRRSGRGHGRGYGRGHERGHDDGRPDYGRQPDYGRGGYALPFGSYVRSCTSCNVGPQVLTCVCSNSRRQLFTSSVFYNYCRSVGNFEGQLVCE